MREVTAWMVLRHYAAETVQPVEGFSGLLIQSLVAGGRWQSPDLKDHPFVNLADEVIQRPAEVVRYFVVARTRIVVALEDLILNSLPFLTHSHGDHLVDMVV